MSKFEAVLRRIRRLAPDEKCLVFSAFDEALTKLAVALRQNHVSCVRLVGGREVHSRNLSLLCASQVWQWAELRTGKFLILHLVMSLCRAAHSVKAAAWSGGV